MTRTELKQLILEALNEDSNKVSDLVSKFKDQIIEVDENLSYNVLAKVIATILIDDYGKHNYIPFINELKNNLYVE